MSIDFRKSINPYKETVSMTRGLPHFFDNGKDQKLVEKLTLRDTYSERGESPPEAVFPPNGKYSISARAPTHPTVDKMSSCLALASVLILMSSVVLALPFPLSLAAASALIGPLFISLIAVLKG